MPLSIVPTIAATATATQTNATLLPSARVAQDECRWPTPHYRQEGHNNDESAHQDESYGLGASALVSWLLHADTGTVWSRSPLSVAGTASSTVWNWPSFLTWPHGPRRGECRIS